MTSTTSPITPTQTVELSPSYTLPLVLILLGFPISLIKIWAGFPIALFGLFLMFQAVTLRLQFTDTSLDIYRSDTLIRRFPYQDWLNWRIFWTPVPILFYFKEVKSIHFLPIIFDPKTLKTCLEERCPRI
ncbi:DUF3119 family protein [Limnofasciculus baicalensis]|uniref:DUF3119 family protein n=1 Tax=Limnofasciculus baicalensis BBK-W-15 TaxID=2699891 RepID=A0AAE3GQ34_9CYAN|nr:DUF3119 family protein [Limnofasciculus baicalensis]MCP2728615.1 DUF3119 family protein [Limnofasciculus baicalensis BBK-W-15]